LFKGEKTEVRGGTSEGSVKKGGLKKAQKVLARVRNKGQRIEEGSCFKQSRGRERGLQQSGKNNADSIVRSGRCFGG